jgi:hypothetical protein
MSRGPVHTGHTEGLNFCYIKGTMEPQQGLGLGSDRGIWPWVSLLLRALPPDHGEGLEVSSRCRTPSAPLPSWLSSQIEATQDLGGQPCRNPGSSTMAEVTGIQEVCLAKALPLPLPPTSLTHLLILLLTLVGT